MQFKYLGLFIDQYLTWNQHIEYIHDKTSKNLGAFHKTRTCLNIMTAIHLYKSLILLHFDYGDTIFSIATEHVLNKLQKVQNSLWDNIKSCSL